MFRLKVASSNLVSIGYDAKTKTLEVEFNGGAVYQYFNVPSNVYGGLLTAPSVGKFFRVHVQEAGYSYKRVDLEETDAN